MTEYNRAGVMELADMQDLGSCEATRAGSSPVARRIKGTVRRWPAVPFIKVPGQDLNKEDPSA